MHNLYSITGYPDPPGTMEEEEEEEEEEQEEDYENMAPPYKDLPPKPGSSAPPRPPRAEKETEQPPLPCKPQNMTGLDLASLTCPPPQLAVNLEPSPLQPSLAATPAPWLNQTSEGPGCCQKRWMVYLCLLVVISLFLGCLGLTVSLIKYQELMEELRMLNFQQMTWRANSEYFMPLLLSPNPILRSNSKIRPHPHLCWALCPHPEGRVEEWLSEWSLYLQNFVAKAHGSPRVYWLGLNDRGQEGDWRWLDGSPVTLSFWEPEEPNNMHNEDCATMNKDGRWNDLSCYKTTYWICERKCSC
ncbi:PREDICTED: C-type lectin domain family 17, member A [Rhinopithecus bieti]|uniref:C-type lectin domain family 17, member A n=1 Tax=Rhinopithecus bieti TaxID=61621 RepID=UPI00083C5348|nr:PREDICTED: C-type lectin domain family 17, member A [Rhinopithecus bieti]